MAFQLPNGAIVQVGSTLADPITITAASNAKGVEFTVDDVGDLAANDEIIITSGWSFLNYLVARVTKVDASKKTVTVGVVDTSDTNFFPAGNGVGSLQKITAWTVIPQITEVAQSGGDQQYIQIQFLEDDRQRNIATYKAAKTQTFTLAHDSSLPVYDVLKAGDRRGDTLPLKMYVPKATETRYWSGTPSFDPQPTTAVNAVETVQAGFAIKSMDMTFYKDASAAPKTVAVTGVSLDKSTLSLAAGGTATLTATVSPTDAANKKVTWKSSDSAIATVSDAGKVTVASGAAAASEATITVTTDDGSFTATCKATVTSA